MATIQEANCTPSLLYVGIIAKGKVEETMPCKTAYAVSVKASADDALMRKTRAGARTVVIYAALAPVKIKRPRVLTPYPIKIPLDICGHGGTSRLLVPANMKNPMVRM